MAVNGLYHEPIIKEEMQGMTTVWGYPSQTIRNNTSALNLIKCRNLLFYWIHKFTGISVTILLYTVRGRYRTYRYTATKGEPNEASLWKFSFQKRENSHVDSGTFIPPPIRFFLHDKHVLDQCSGSKSGSTGSSCFWPPGSGSTSQRYGSGYGSGPFYDHAKIIRKILNPTILWLFLTFYLWKIM